MFVTLQKDETSSLSKIFDPTIYSMQPLQMSSSNSNIPDADSRNFDDVNSLSQSNDEFMKHRTAISDAGDDPSIPALSRKTSTASECTTMSDYTPENTITSSITSSPPTIPTLHNVLPSDSSTHDTPTILHDRPLDGVSNAIIPPTNPVSTNMATIPFIDADTEKAAVLQNLATPQVVPNVSKDVEAAPPKTDKAHPVRKISRFLVSPAILTVTNEKSVPHTPTDEHAPRTPNAMVNAEVPFETIAPSNVVNQPNVVNLSSELAAASNILNVDPALSGKIAEFITSVNPPFNATEILGQPNSIAAKELQEQLKKQIGPDHINTLEQLKIELENITHAHMITKLLADNDIAVQLTPEMIMRQHLDQQQLHPGHEQYMLEVAQQQHHQMMHNQMHPGAVHDMSTMSEPLAEINNQHLLQQANVENMSDQ